MAGVAQELQELRSVADGSFKNLLASAAAGTWLTYDILLTMDQEVELIWSSKWSLPKFLYLATRYFGVANLFFAFAVNSLKNPSLEFCRIYSWLELSSGSIFFATTVNMVFLLRLRALYSGDKKVQWLLYSLYAGEFIATVVIGILTIKGVHFFPKPQGLPIPGCLSDRPPRLTVYAWVPAAVVACIYFFMTLHKFVSLVKEERGKLTLSVTMIKTPVISLFMRDGAAFFAVLFVVLMMNIIFNTGFENGPLMEVGQLWLMATYSFAGCRLILNLRSLFRESADKTLYTAAMEMRPTNVARPVRSAPLQFARSEEDTLDLDDPREYTA